MATTTQAVPKGLHAVTPSLMVTGAPEAIEFYTKAFGAVELMRFPGPDGAIMHAEMRIGDSTIMLGEEMGQGGGSPKRYGGTPVAFFLYAEDVDGRWKRAIDAGAKEIMALTDQFWGDRAGCVEDPFGHRWWLAEHMKDLTPEEMKRAADHFFAEMQAAS